MTGPCVQVEEYELPNFREQPSGFRVEATLLAPSTERAQR